VTTTAAWLGCVFTLRELSELTDDELCQLEEIAGDTALVAQWWRRRRLRENAREAA
jgi:hypothetical protein